MDAVVRNVLAGNVPRRSATVYGVVALAAAAVLGASIGHDQLHMPLPVGDSFSLMLDAAKAPSAWAEFQAHLSDVSFFRPGYYATIKLVSDLGNGHYFLAYRLFHTLLIFALLILFTRALQVHDRLTLAVAPLALTIFLGVHTFLVTVRSIWGISHFFQVAVLTLAALNLTQTRGGVLVDIALMVTFALAAVTLESGPIVWVVIVAAWVSGMPGVSKRSVMLVSALLAAYLWMLFGQESVGPPPIGERSTGYWFERLDPPQIIERFGDNPARLYAYNVLSSVMSIPLSEPRGGIWSTTQALVRNRLELRDLIRMVSALFATGLIVAYVVDRLRSGVRRPATMSDRHVVIFGAVLVANAVVAFVYTKDEIISTAGAFYALPVYGAAVHFLRRWPDRRRSWGATAALCLLFLVGSAAWATRAAGVHHVLRTTAFVQRNDWTRIERLWRRDGNWERYADSEALIRQIREESILMRVVNPYFMPRWMDRVFDTN